MIYLDNAATTLQKPPEVGQATLAALQTAGNPGRGAHEPTLHAARLVYGAREALAELFHAESPACIAFAANATQALNTALCGLLAPGDHVLTTVCEHNSVLRPLYRLRGQGVQVDFVGVDEQGKLRCEQFAQRLRPNTKAIVVTHASNVTGCVTDLVRVSAFAKAHGLLMIVDAAQTAGARPIDVQELGLDVLCFTGHKALLGPQGTGGLYVRPGLQMAPLVVGGSGVHSFAEAHPSEMPTALEAGTLNVPGLAGLEAGARWILAQGVEALCAKETALARLFYENIRGIPGVVVYGGFTGGAPCAHCLAEPGGGGLCPGGGRAVGRIRHLRAGRSPLCPPHAQGAGHRGAGDGAVQLLPPEHRAGSPRRRRRPAGAGRGGVNHARKTTLHRVVLRLHRGRHGLGKALRGENHPRAAHPAAAGAFGRVRPCVADAAGGVGPVGKPKLDRTAFDAVAEVMQ